MITKERSVADASREKFQDREAKAKCGRNEECFTHSQALLMIHRRWVRKERKTDVEKAEVFPGGAAHSHRSTKKA